MSRYDLTHEILNLALENGRQTFFPSDGGAYDLLSSFGVVNAGLSYHKPPFEICRLSFPYHSAYFCLKGEGRYYTPSGGDCLAEGEVLTLPAYCPHRYWVEGEWQYIWVDFRDQGHWATLLSQNEMKFRTHRIEQLRRVAEGIEEQMHSWREADALEDWIRLFITYLGWELKKRAGKTDRWLEVFAGVWREVRNSPERNWRIDDLASIAHASIPNFSRLMQRIYGMPASEMLARIRVGKALSIMRTTHITLDRVAELTGYSSAYALSKAFRRIYGLSPRRKAEE